MVGSTFMWLSRTLKNSGKISSLLKWIVGYLCKACGSGFASVLERQRALLGRQVSSHSCLAKVL